MNCCALLGRLLEQFVDPRLEHLAELLVESVADEQIAAAARWLVGADGTLH